MKLPSTAHTSRPWRIHDITRDFHLEDVWALPTPGGPDDFPRLVQQFAEGDSSDNPSWVVHALFAIRWRLGALFNWDDPKSGIGSRVSSLHDRLPVNGQDHHVRGHSEAREAGGRTEVPTRMTPSVIRPLVRLITSPAGSVTGALAGAFRVGDR